MAAILALVAAATLLPHVFKTNASQKPTAADTQAVPSSPDAGGATSASTPAPDTSQQPNPLSTATPAQSQPAPVVTQPGLSTASSPKTQAVKQQQQAVSHALPSQVAVQQQPVPAAPAGPSPQEIRQARDRYSNLEARADAARSGVQQLRSQQQAQGFDIRGDVLGSLNRMNAAMNEANRALSQNDLQTADSYMDRADTEVSGLEKFLNIR